MTDSKYLLYAILSAFVGFQFLKGFLSNRNTDKLSLAITSIVGFITVWSILYIAVCFWESNALDRRNRKELKTWLTTHQIEKITVNTIEVDSETKENLLEEILKFEEHHAHHTHPNTSFEFEFHTAKNETLILFIYRDSYVENEYRIFKEAVEIGSFRSDVFHKEMLKYEKPMMSDWK